MSVDVLTQEQIDALLAAANDESTDLEQLKQEEPARKIKVYDFKRPDKFSKDQIRTLYMLHESFARLLNTYMSSHLRTLVNVDVASVEQLTYQEFVQSLVNPSVITILGVPPLKGNIIFEISTEIAFAYLDRVFGGDGTTAIKSRVLTEIEDAVMRRFVNSAMERFKESWSNVTPMNPILEATESNPQFTQIVPPNDMVVIITMNTKLGEVEGFMNICIPYLVLEPIMSKLTTTFWVAASAAKDDKSGYAEIIRKKLNKTKVPFVVEVGRVQISIREFLTLGFGDVLQLNTKVKEDFPCMVGSNAKFLCRPGTFGKKLAVQITQVVQKGEEAADDDE
ncbi:MAG: flagellar motor switch protein FliM [Selenomonadaceae bacterium]|nr:flagellar motor switch protein FliM [Quinella sp. 1Q5]MBR0103647.1 flagellar motor switch protein FliM [Selenomonadaceae bacterium]MBR2775165.1 flagellar motor switch protein FliM [Selenomonadaceae bacterium]MBR6713067.1 flagellar motor switch protein FliM [Selenomonadaceae bacterium]